jgi:hypothetical protein
VDAVKHDDDSVRASTLIETAHDGNLLEQREIALKVPAAR